MKMVCPYCKQAITGEMAFPLLRPRWLRVYRAVLEAGASGISTDDLLVRMYAEDEWPTPGGSTVLRVCIHGINKVIKPLDQRIVNAFRGNYRLVHGAEEEKRAEEVQSEANH